MPSATRNPTFLSKTIALFKKSLTQIIRDKGAQNYVTAIKNPGSQHCRSFYLSHYPFFKASPTDSALSVILSTVCFTASLLS